MRLLSNIIKGGRIRNQSIMDFSLRNTHEVEGEEIEEIKDELFESKQEGKHSETLEMKQRQLQEIEHIINEKISDANQKAEQIIAAALERAQYIESDAQTRKNDMIFEMNQEKEGLLAKAKEKAEQIQLEAYEEKKAILASTEEEVTQTMIILLQHIIGEELNYHTDWVSCLVKKMLSDQDTDEKVKVILSPSLFERLPKAQKEAITQIKKQVVLETCEALNDTTCMVETSHGSIRYDVQEGLERVISDIRILQNVK